MKFYLLIQVVPVTNYASCLNMESVCRTLVPKTDCRSFCLFQLVLGDDGVLRSYEYLEEFSAVYESNHHVMPSTDRANVVSSVRAFVFKIRHIKVIFGHVSQKFRPYDFKSTLFVSYERICT